MKRKLTLLLVSIIAIILTSCLTTFMPTDVKRGGERLPDGVNNSIVYGSIDLSDSSLKPKLLNKKEVPKQGYTMITIVPWESDVVAGSAGGEIIYKVNNIERPEIHDYERLSGGFFDFRNLKPGYYYIGVIYYNDNYETSYSIKLPKPDTVEQCILVKTNSISYWGSAKLIKEFGNNFKLITNEDVTKEAVNQKLIDVYDNRPEWNEIIQNGIR